MYITWGYLDDLVQSIETRLLIRFFQTNYKRVDSQKRVGFLFTIYVTYMLRKAEWSRWQRMDSKLQSLNGQKWIVRKSWRCPYTPMWTERLS